MKKLFFSAFALLLIVQAASAQYYRPHYRARKVPTKTYDNNFRPTFTLIGGMNISNIIQSSGYNFNTRTKLGVNAGLGFDLPVSYPLSITIEGLYSQKGYTTLTPGGEYSQRTDYIDVPLLLKFHVVPGFNLLLGPQASFLVSTRNTFDNGIDQTTRLNYNNSTDGYNKALITGVAGVSFDLSRNVELRGRYNIDLTRNNENGNTAVPPYRNSVFQVGLGIKF
ncbi:porin family protein [Mucilaginibacter ginkgonis]|uniref:PorT family protein n=1 Tax=Mucilaginibacter ginkgonis TaxID=2682091 RepID=A0A6I4HXL9_9SPHI|nr:porin family protein [Mucilaginibacter ginkgonis]QQL49412.1 PorT family protein [Mucilaginibacter ginkgonis]